MPTKSFRKDFSVPPSQYRTPSPPRCAIEPISPIRSAFQEPLGHKSRQNHFDGGFEELQSHSDENKLEELNRLQGPMDAFASIALATNQANGIQAHTSSLVHPSKAPPPAEETYGEERPSKRARSEKLQTSEWPRDRADAGIRPTTSYEQSSDSRTLEAELLLNFSQKARAVTSRVYSGHPDLDCPYGNIGTALKPPKSPSVSTTGQKASGDDGAMDFAAEKLPHGVAKMAQAPLAIVYQQSGPEDATYHGAGIIDGPYMLQDSELQDGHSERASFPKEEEPENPDYNQATSHEARTSQAAGAANPSLGEKASSSANEELQDHLQEIAHESMHVSTGGSEEIVSTVEDKTPTRFGEKTTTSADTKTRQAAVPAACSACHFSRNSSSIDNENNTTSWISCDGCKSWFHFACAGFKSEREVRSVDKYRCRKCRPEHGNTTYVRKSSRAHSAIDYAGLNQGVIKTSDETLEHHYIKPIKDGVISFLPENFARMRPELVTAEFFEKGNGMKEPIVIPAHLNPRPDAIGSDDPAYLQDEELQNSSVVEEWLARDAGLHRVLDHGQDGLDMVMPQSLTVRKVSELYGPEERIEVIDVKSQNGEGKKWNMKRWVDYYESKESKVVRNVISLEVSQSKLGRLIRRPKIVRDLDLQDSVWPQELQQKGEIPRVQLYCLMSVADCFTDFHIDFGGSSVFYHILKGKKTFLFIPPKEKHLKKYEEWCMSPAQNWTFLADQTKECYRVDLAEGDTMLIPAGWIHAVWTPEDSLVIGGNFLTRMHYGMQFRIAQTEKATGVARKFRYPHFQKLHWYSALRYLEKDPLPDSVRELLQGGGTFHRERPAHYDFEGRAEKAEFGSEKYNARYYSQTELEGLPDLMRYLLRTALIDHGAITEGITVETRNAVKRAIPRGFGEPMDLLKEFARWCAWKRGNEQIPTWAYADAVLGESVPEKSSAAALKKSESDAALQGPRRQSARRQAQQNSETAQAVSEQATGSLKGGDQENTRQPSPSEQITPMKRRLPEPTPPEGLPRAYTDVPNKRRKTSGSIPITHRRPACESCRKRRRACKHRDEINFTNPGARASDPAGYVNCGALGPRIEEKPILLVNGDTNDGNGWRSRSARLNAGDDREQRVSQAENDRSPTQENSRGTPARAPILPSRPTNPNLKAPDTLSKGFEPISGNAMYSRGRSKACNDCRKSKVCSSPNNNVDLDVDAIFSAVAYTTRMATRIQSKLVKLQYQGQQHHSSDGVELKILAWLRSPGLFQELGLSNQHA